LEIGGIGRTPSPRVGPLIGLSGEDDQTNGALFHVPVRGVTLSIPPCSAPKFPARIAAVHPPLAPFGPRLPIGWLPLAWHKLTGRKVFTRVWPSVRRADPHAGATDNPALIAPVLKPAT
jgi:hypothetical protein